MKRLRDSSWNYGVKNVIWELIFSLKTSFDDFRHQSKKHYCLFIDFADAFGNVNHQFIFETLVHFNIPLSLCCLIEDLYKYSYFEVICGYELTEIFYIVRGTKTGCPISALIFILIIDRVCKPMIEFYIISFNIANELRISPISSANAWTGSGLILSSI